MKKTWQTINEILGRTKANIRKTNCILEAGKMIYEPKEIANTFNTHFSTISCKLTDISTPCFCNKLSRLLRFFKSLFYVFLFNMPTRNQNNYIYFKAKVEFRLGWYTFIYT